MVAVAAPAAGQDGPHRVQLAVLAEQVPAAEPRGVDVPDPHVRSVRAAVSGTWAPGRAARDRPRAARSSDRPAGDRRTRAGAPGRRGAPARGASSTGAAGSQ